MGATWTQVRLGSNQWGAGGAEPSSLGSGSGCWCWTLWVLGPLWDWELLSPSELRDRAPLTWKRLDSIGEGVEEESVSDQLRRRFCGERDEGQRGKEEQRH